MAANEERADCFILVYNKQDSSSKTQVSIWSRTSKWLFLKLMLLSNYRTTAGPKTDAPPGIPWTTRSRLHPPELFLTTPLSWPASSARIPDTLGCLITDIWQYFVSSGTPLSFLCIYAFKAFIPTPPKSPIPPFLLYFFVWTWLIVEEEGMAAVCFG